MQKKKTDNLAIRHREALSKGRKAREGGIAWKDTYSADAGSVREVCTGRRQEMKLNTGKT